MASLAAPAPSPAPPPAEARSLRELTSATWPKRWRPWIAAVLQTGVNVGVLLAATTVYLLADSPPRNVFLVGILPAFLVFWIRRSVPEPEEWTTARQKEPRASRVGELF